MGDLKKYWCDLEEMFSGIAFNVSVFQSKNN